MVWCCINLENQLEEHHGARVVAKQVVVASPLIRALETAAGAFGGGKWQGRGSVLMLEQTAIPGVRASHTAVGAVAGLPFVAFEGCRERLGKLSPSHTLTYTRPANTIFLSVTEFHTADFLIPEWHLLAWSSEATLQGLAINSCYPGFIKDVPVGQPSWSATNTTFSLEEHFIIQLMLWT